MTAADSVFIFENIPASLLNNTDDQTGSALFPDILNLDENSDNTTFANSVILNQSIDINQNKSNEMTTVSLSSIYTPLSNRSITNNNESILADPLNISVDNESSVSSSSNGSCQHQVDSQLEVWESNLRSFLYYGSYCFQNNNETKFIGAKLEKVHHNFEKCQTISFYII